MNRQYFARLVIGTAIMVLIAGCDFETAAQSPAITFPMDPDDIAGVVTSNTGTEGGKGSKPIVVHFQVRPDPLAK